jgi:hypothetical protein
MGSLKPGATYVYERSDGVTYAREFGSDPSTREAIGWDYDKNNPTFDPRTFVLSATEDKLWKEIRTAAQNNPSLQQALERVKILYYLSKENGDSKT